MPPSPGVGGGEDVVSVPSLSKVGGVDVVRLATPKESSATQRPLQARQAVAFESQYSLPVHSSMSTELMTAVPNTNNIREQIEPMVVSTGIHSVTERRTSKIDLLHRYHLLIKGV